MAMLNGKCERAVTTYVLGSVWWSNKHVKSYSYPRSRVHTDQDDLSRGKIVLVVFTSSTRTWLSPHPDEDPPSHLPSTPGCELVPLECSPEIRGSLRK